jgi:predicted TIM-barrel fold metal-dependent hydrolase
LENPQLYFDSSFTLSYWKGSSVEQDFAFAIKKLGGDRVLFGSDYPYSDVGKELGLQNAFLDAHNVEEEHKSFFFGAAAGKVISNLENNICQRT